jgi:hypothetical protein
VQEQHSLVYVGPLAGRMPGIVQTKEGLVLVTKGFTLIEPRKGDWSFIQRMLLERMGEEQTRHFDLYLKLGYEDLRQGKLTPGLFLAIVGPVNMHKTCVQELIITPIFGGRVAEPHQFFTSASEFNGDFIGAEHLIITDIDVKGDNRNTHFTSKVKQYCGTSSHRIHPKNREAFQALAFWRISQSCNDDYPHILALPDLGDPTVTDKILLLYFDGKPFERDFMPSERNDIRAKIDAALPGYLYHLINMPVQGDLFDGRFGQVPYKNPTALDKYFNVTKEATLLEIIDAALFDENNRGFLHKPHLRRNTKERWQGFTMDLERELKERDYAHRCEKIGATGNMLGRMLTSIAENTSTSERIRITTRNGRSYYHISPPTPTK